jgi:hypothetical protein
MTEIIVWAAPPLLESGGHLDAVVARPSELSLALARD